MIQSILLHLTITFVSTRAQFLTTTSPINSQMVNGTSTGAINTTLAKVTGLVSNPVTGGVLLNQTELSAVNLTSPNLNGTINLPFLNGTLTSVLNETFVNASSNTFNTTLLPVLNGTLPEITNLTIEHVNVTAIDAVNGTSLILNGTSIFSPVLNGSFPVITNLTIEHVNVTAVDVVNSTSLTLNGTSILAPTLNETISLNDTLVSNTTNETTSQLPSINGTVNLNETLLNPNPMLTMNEPTPQPDATQVVLTENQTMNSASTVPTISEAILNATTNVLNETVNALNSALTSMHFLIQLISNEISLIQLNLPEKSNALTFSINVKSRRVQELFLNSHTNFALYCIADLQSFGATVEKVVSNIGRNISELYEDFSSTVSHDILNSTTIIADYAKNISILLQSAAINNTPGAEECMHRINPQALAFSDNYINLVGACSTDQEKKVKTLASYTMSTSASMFSLGREIVSNLNNCMDLPNLNLNDSRMCVADVCSQLPLTAVNIQMEASLIQAGIIFDIKSLRDRVTYCAVMRSAEATNKINVLMEMTKMCLAGKLT